MLLLEQQLKWVKKILFQLQFLKIKYIFRRPIRDASDESSILRDAYNYYDRRTYQWTTSIMREL